MNNFLETNSSKRLHELSYGIIVRLANAMRKNWKDVLNEIPDMPLSEYDVEQYLEALEKQGKNPAEAMFSILGRRGIKLDALKTSFERLSFEEGLRIIGYKAQPLQSYPLFPSEIRLQKGTRLELSCRSFGFPVPQHLYKKNGITLYEGNPYIIESVDLEDSGPYQCVVTQEYEYKTFNTYVVVEDLQDINVKIEPTIVKYNVGTKFAHINALVNVETERKLIYQWFKRGYNSNNDQAIMNNPTATTQTLTLKDITVDDAGYYTCEVSDGIQKVIGRGCKVNIKSESKFDLKMALIIGNGDYNRYKCDVCENLDFHFDNLSVSTSLINLKQKLEQNDFIVMAYIDLEAEAFLRVIRLFKEKCSEAKNVLAFIYVGAHGFHYGTNDYLVPVDINMHENHKSTLDRDAITRQASRHCSLANLLENFSNEDDSDKTTKFSVICFWDLCRSTYIDFPTDSYSVACKNLEYTIIYCCNVGSKAYEIKDVGSIMLSLFIDHFTDNRSLQEILTDVDKSFQEKKKINKVLEIVNPIKIHSTVGEKFILSQNATKSRDYRNLIEDLKFKSFNHKTKIDIPTGTGEIFRFYYQFTRDNFLNAIQLDVEQENTFYPLIIESSNPKIIIENPDEKRNLFRYRIKGIQNLLNEDLLIELSFNKENSEILKERITLPTNAFHIIRHLYSYSIDSYVSSKFEAQKSNNSLNDTTDIDSFSDYNF